MQTALNRTRTRIVQSRQNGRVKELRSTLAHGGLSRDGRVALEGLHLVQEALRSSLPLHTVFLREGDESLLNSLDLGLDTEILVLHAEIFASAVTTETPQGIAALASPHASQIGSLFQGVPLIIVAAGLQDPGNLGTILRSAEAFGSTGVITLPGTVSPWNAKALRASSGSAFRMPIVALPEKECLDLLQKEGLQTFATVVIGGESLESVDLAQPAAFFIGNEGSGLSKSLLERAGARITIPCTGPVESLNAAVATSVLLYESSRQRSLRPGKTVPAKRATK